MKRQAIRPSDLAVRIHRTWNDDWFLLTSGDLSARDFNTMTVAWGSLGIMWSKPIAMVVVRPTRYTYRFMEKYQDFTMSLLGEEHRDALDFCGSHSGRDTDKVAETGLTPIAVPGVGSPAFGEAELIFACRILYWEDFSPERFRDPSLSLIHI